MWELQSVPQAFLGVLRIPIPHPGSAPEGPDSRARGAARLGGQRQDSGQPGQSPAAVHHPSGAGAHPEHAAEHRRQHGPAEPADCESSSWRLFVS